MDKGIERSLSNPKTRYVDNNYLAAVDTETTGLVPGYHEIVELAVVPLTITFKPVKLPFHVYIKPMYPDRLYEEATQKKRNEIAEICMTGFDKSKVIDMFDEWFVKTMAEYGTNKFIALGQNYAFDQAHLRAFFGDKLYAQYFHYHYRDSMVLAHAMNDIALMRGEKMPYPKTSLSNLCSTLGVELRNAHQAIDDAVATAGCYAKMLEHSVRLV
jgi:DNA polymerase III epsilon subunit-like protein